MSPNARFTTPISSRRVAVELDVVAPAADRARGDAPAGAAAARRSQPRYSASSIATTIATREGRGDAPEEVGARARQVLDRRRERERADGAEVLRAARRRRVVKTPVTTTR